MDKTILSVYGSHNAAVALYHNGEIKVAEIERWVNIKNAGLTTYMPSFNKELVFEEVCKYMLKDVDKVNTYMTDYMSLDPCFEYDNHLNFDHHEAHAATAFYQSPYEKALSFTYDGGGDGGFFNVYMCDREKGITLLDKFDQDLGFPYMILGNYMEDIKKESLNIGNLVYAGKVMGLCSYGELIGEWIEPLKRFYSKFIYGGNSYRGGAEVMKDAVPILMEEIGIKNFTPSTRIKGQTSWNLARTSQHVFEEEFYKYAKKYLTEYKDLPVCLAGGCALNVLLNTRLLHERNGKVFVPPNTNDCGIAVGGLLLQLQPKEQVDLTYSGLPILDHDMLSSYVEDYRLHSKKVTIAQLAQIIKDEKIVGIVNGNAEHGSRALGNRSILCNPVDGMKDKLNERVKHREWYRPFAPIVRLEDTPKYFELDEGVESRHMVFVANVREEYRNIIPSVTHEDGTGRLQTVKKEQNEFIHELLTEYAKIGDTGVLLNTSFNDNGSPILSTLKDAFNLLHESEMDCVYYDGKVFFKENSKDKSYYVDFENFKYPEGTLKIVQNFDNPNIHELDYDILLTDEKYKSVLGTHDNIIYFSNRNFYYMEFLEVGENSVKEFSKHLHYIWKRDVLRSLIGKKKVKHYLEIQNLDDSSDYMNGKVMETDKYMEILNTLEILFSQNIHDMKSFDKNKKIKQLYNSKK